MENRSCQVAELEQREEAQRGCTIGQQKELSLDEELGSWRMIKGRSAMLYRKLEELGLVMESKRGAVTVQERIIQAEDKELCRSILIGNR